MIIIILILYGRKNNCSGDDSQESQFPEVIANNLRVKIGIKALFELWFHVIGLDLIFDLLENVDIRIEYEAVIPIDKVINININILKFDEIIFSKIISFEKNPDINGIPIRAILFTPKIDKIIGKFIKFIPIIRISWYEDSWIMIPAQRNIADLNNAWIIKCIKARVIEFSEIANIIIAICLRVDNAMIFFKSCSQLADILA